MPWQDYATLLATASTAGSGVSPAWITAAIALVAAVAGCIAWAARWGWRILKRTTHFLDDYFGEPARPGFPDRPGVMQRLQSLTDDVARIQAQVIPNGGSSLRDAVDHLAAGVKLVAEDLTEHRLVTGPAITQLTADVSELRRRVELFEHERSDREDDNGG